MMTGIWGDAVAYWPDLLRGVFTSLQLTAAALAIGLPLALLFAVMGMARSRVVKTTSVVLVELGRAIPLLVVLQFVYYGLPTAGLSLGSLAASVASLAWMTGVYGSEIIRGGLLSVHSDQEEAAKALGLTRIDALRFVIIPQGIRVAMPPIVGFAIIVFQSTSLCFTIALPELMASAYGIGSKTFRYIDIFVLVSLVYGLIVMPISRLTGRWENKMSSHIA